MYLFLLGIIIGVLGIKLWEFKQNKNIKFSKIEYVAGVIWLAWVAFGVIFVVLNFGEGEARAGSLGALIFGGVAILALIGLRILHMKKKESSTPSSKSTSVSA